MHDDGQSPRLHHAAGELIYVAGNQGGAWMLESGSIRLDRITDNDEPDFAGIAIKGDVVGAETLLLGTYAFSATALTPCELRAWPGAAREVNAGSLLEVLSTAGKRSADAIALRCGEASARVHKFIHLIAAATPGKTLTRLMLPALRDMADITDLTVGTVSRVLADMQSNGSLAMEARRRGRPKGVN